MSSPTKQQLINRSRLFLKQTTIHGLPFFTKDNLHPLERIFWIIIVSLATVASVLLCLSNWRRFYANPTVVTLQKDYRNWNNYFPAATMCYLAKYNDILADAYIQEKWSINASHSKYNYYLDFVKAVANTSYDSLMDFAQFENDDTLNSIDFMDLSAMVLPPIKGTLVTFDTKRKTDWKKIITEFGICFSVNIKFGDALSFKIRGKNQTKDDNYILKCHYLNGLCYARYDSDPTNPLKIYIHSYLDVVHATIDPPLVIKESEELEINYRMQETLASASLRNLRPTQRGCRFDDEPLTSDISVYSTSFCYINCRYRMAMKFCGCRPFFYHNMGGKECDIKGMLCVGRHADEITQPPAKIGCMCPQPCNLIAYTPLAPKRTVWQYGYFDQRITFRWGLIPPTTKYNRDVLFGFEDLVVAFGGILALFLGVSFISGIEIIVFIIESLLHTTYSIIFKKKRNDNEIEENKARQYTLNTRVSKINVIPINEGKIYVMRQRKQ